MLLVFPVYIFDIFGDSSRKWGVWKTIVFLINLKILFVIMFSSYNDIWATEAVAKKNSKSN